MGTQNKEKNMGLEVTNINTDGMQLRYMGLNITKGERTAHAAIQTETGFYMNKEDNTGWIKVLSDTVYLDNDTLGILMNMKPSQLGLPADSTSYVMLETLIYAVLSGKIPITAEYTINIKDENTDEPVKGHVKLGKSDYFLYNSQYETPQSTWVLDKVKPSLNVTLEVSADGYKTVTKPIAVWYSTKTLDITLEKVVAETTTTTTQETSEEPTTTTKTEGSN